MHRKCRAFLNLTALIALGWTSSAAEGAIPLARLDFDASGTVDALDEDVFLACMSGPAVAAEKSLACRIADTDDDGDVDQVDFGLFQCCFSGSKPAVADCAGILPPLTATASANGDEDTDIPITLTGFDPHAPLATLTFAITELPAQGTLAQSDGTPISEVPAAVSDPAGVVKFRPAPNGNGSPYGTLAYTVTSPATSLTSAPGSVQIAVNPVNDPPVIPLWYPLVYEDTPAIMQLWAEDPDLPNDQLTFIIAIRPNIFSSFYQVDPDGTPRTDLPPIGNGDIVTNPDRKVWFVPRPNWHSRPGYPTVMYRLVVVDAAGASDIRDTPIDIEGLPDPPQVSADTHAMGNDQASITIIKSVFDWDAALGDSYFSICFTELPQHGTLYADGVTPITTAPSCFPTTHYVYVWDGYRPFDCTPDPTADMFPLQDSFSFHADDGVLQSDTFIDPIEIRYFNSPPVFAGPTSVSTVEETNVAFTPAFTDADGDAYDLIVVDPLPTRGVLYYYSEDALLYVPVLAGVNMSPRELLYVPYPDADTANGVPDAVHIRAMDYRFQSPLDPRDCDYQIPIHIAPLNDPPEVTCYFTPYIIASVSAEGQISPASTNLLAVADDAQPDELLAVTMTAGGPEADHLVLADQTGLVGFQQVSPTQIQFQGTLAAINAAFAQGVYWYPNGSQTYAGELTVEVNDQGHAGSEDPPVPLAGTLVLPVSVEYEGTIPLTP